MKPAAFFDAAAAAYDQPFHEQFYGRVAAELAARLPAGLAVDNLLEAGAGTGFATQVLQDHFPGAQITALEPSPRMLARGKRRLPGAEWICLPLDGMTPGSFDLVIASMSYQWLNGRERQKIVKLAAGGALALALPLSRHSNKNGNRTLRKIVFQMRGGNWPRQARRPRAVEASLRQCFQKLEFGSIAIDEEYENCQNLCRSLLERGAMHSLFGDRVETAAAALAAESGGADFSWTIGLFVAW